jgi:hypothetical protein
MQARNREPRAVVYLFVVAALTPAAVAVPIRKASLPPAGPGVPGLSAEEKRLLQPLTGPRMMPWIDRLCRKELAGRKAGTEGAGRAVEALVNHFRRLGLEDLEGASGFRQPFTMSFSLLRSRWDRRATLVNGTGGKPLQVVYPDFPARECALRGETAFLGYGIRRPDRQWDDFAGVNLKNRLAVFWNGAPSGVSQELAARCRAARDQGAIGCIVLTRERGRDDDGEMVDRGVGQLLSDYPVIQLSHESAARLFGRAVPRPVPKSLLARGGGRPARAVKAAKESERERQERLAAKELTSSSEEARSGVEERGRAAARRPPAPRLGRISLYIPPSVDPARPLDNVLGAWRGQDPILRDEWVVISAHLDHLGQDGKSIFHGADDDASGVAVVCAVAEAFRSLGVRPRRSVLFALWNGEECGLLGSRHFVDKPPIPLERIVGVLQLDMVGVGQPEAFLTSARRKPSLFFRCFEEAARGLGLALPGDTVRGISDHIPFQRSGVPALVATTAGVHPNYHSAGDRPRNVLPAALENSARLSALTLWRVANETGESSARKKGSNRVAERLDEE